MKSPRSILKGNGPRTIPSVVQLPGGVRLQGVPFRIVERHDDGSPRLFEIMPSGTKVEGPDLCVLFANEEWIRRGQ